jgi:uncharacterized protein YbaA (DUF1428 family)
MSYVDFFCIPLKKGGEPAYMKMVDLFSEVMVPKGMLSYCEAVADNVPRGEVTDFYRAVAAKDDETVVAAYCLWPDKATRDRAWEEMMSDPKMAAFKPEDMPFDGKRMFWGGFRPLKVIR